MFCQIIYWCHCIICLSYFSWGSCLAYPFESQPILLRKFYHKRRNVPSKCSLQFCDCEETKDTVQIPSGQRHSSVQGNKTWLNQCIKHVPRLGVENRKACMRRSASNALQILSYGVLGSFWYTQLGWGACVMCLFCGLQGHLGMLPLDLNKWDTYRHRDGNWSKHLCNTNC